MERSLEAWRKALDGVLVEYRTSVGTERQERKALVKAERKLKQIEEAQRIIQEVAQAVQEQAHEQIAGVVTRCLQLVGYNYEFHIQFERKRGKTEARLVFVREDVVFDDPLHQCSGGAVDVAAFACRLAALLLSVPQKRKVLILDEPFRNINGERYQSKVGEMLLTLSRETGVQMIIVTDDEWLKNVGKNISLTTY